MLKIEFDREADGRWIAEVRALPGVLVYGTTEEEARANVTALAFQVMSDPDFLVSPAKAGVQGE